MKLILPPYALTPDRFSQNEWIFEESEEAFQATEEFDGILDVGRSIGGAGKSATLLRRFLKRFPWHFDAFTHYGLLRLNERKTLEAYAFFHTAVALAKNCFPREFNPAKHRIPGGFVQNRPYLRALSNLMNCCDVMGDTERASELGYELLSLDPDDRMNVRFELPKYLLGLGRYERASKLFETRRYKDTFHMAIYLYPLVLLHLGKKKEATAAILECLDYPQTARYLLNPDLPMPPPELSFGGLISGNEAEGFYFARQYLPYWIGCPQSLELLREQMTRRG
jgi:tetratricopeptide (TPR) repeat protein